MAKMSSRIQLDNLPKLPDSWTWAITSEVCSSVRDGTHDTPKYVEEGIPLVTSKNLRNGCIEFSTAKNISKEDHEEISKRSDVENGDVIFAMIGTLGNPVVVDSDIMFSIKNVGLFKKKDSVISSNYLRFWLDNPIFWEIIENEDFIKGSTQKFISLNHLRNIPVPLPPLNEQRRIVAKLDRLFARSRRAREELARVSGLCDRYKQAVLAAAFRGDLTADWQEKNSKVEPWQSNSLGSVIQNIRYGTSKKCDYSPTFTPVLRIPNIGNGYIIHDDIKYAEFDSKEIAGLQLQLGDILIIRSNGSLDLVGKSAIVSNREAGFLYAGYLIRLRPNRETILPEYLHYHLIEPRTRSKIELLAKSTSGVNNINSQELQSLSLDIPGLQEQEEIVQRVEKLFKAIDLMEQEYQKASKLCDRLEQATLAKAFRGELVSQDPNDEPAAALLERIRAERQEPPKRKAVKSKQKLDKRSGSSDQEFNGNMRENQP